MAAFIVMSCWLALCLLAYPSTRKPTLSGAMLEAAVKYKKMLQNVFFANLEQHFLELIF